MQNSELLSEVSVGNTTERNEHILSGEFKLR